MSSKIIRISNRSIVDDEYGVDHVFNDVAYVEFDDGTVGATFTSPGYNGETWVYCTTNIYNVDGQFDTKRPNWYVTTYAADGSLVKSEEVGALYIQLENAIRQWYAEATAVVVVN